MRIFRSLHQTTRARRWAPIIGAVGMLALLSGCIIVPGGGYHHDHYYWR